MKFNVYHHRIIFSLLTEPKNVNQIIKQWGATRNKPYYDAIKELWKHGWLVKNKNDYAIYYKQFTKWFIDTGIHCNSYYKTRKVLWKEVMRQNKNKLTSFFKSKAFKHMMQEKIDFYYSWRGKYKPKIEDIISFTYWMCEKETKQKEVKEIKKLIEKINKESF